MAVNTCLPLYEPGRDVTAKALTAVIGKRVVAIAGNGSVPNPLVAHAAAAAKAFGVAAYDAPAGDEVPIIRGGIVPIKAAAAITANAEVEVGAAGQVIPKAAGIAVGYAIFDAANGADCFVHFYN
ncbi:capsid cement protein [Kribbella catacumbae]|uniref:capsid cement protein n=1 Tax=Kribbella catacumbae TaxID=460086 RepID=UPI00037C3423|nr:capsid cement protein [Kribbella catacumbae]